MTLLCMTSDFDLLDQMYLSMLLYITALNLVSLSLTTQHDPFDLCFYGATGL